MENEEDEDMCMAEPGRIFLATRISKGRGKNKRGFCVKPALNK
jgi:hypothetical protein